MLIFLGQMRMDHENNLGDVETDSKSPLQSYAFCKDSAN